LVRREKSRLAQSGNSLRRNSSVALGATADISLADVGPFTDRDQTYEESPAITVFHHTLEFFETLATRLKEPKASI
jgi:hypothetical protein